MEVHMSNLTFQRCAENALFVLMDTLLTALNHQQQIDGIFVTCLKL